MVSSSAAATVVLPGQGDVIGMGLVHKVRGEALAIQEGTMQPGEEVGRHTHSREDQYSFVIEGEVTFELGDEVVVAPAGSYVFKPRGVPHGFRNSGTTPARVIEMSTPGAFGGFYDDMAAAVEQGPEALAAVQERYGVVFHR